MFTLVCTCMLQAAMCPMPSVSFYAPSAFLMQPPTCLRPRFLAFQPAHVSVKPRLCTALLAAQNRHLQQPAAWRQTVAASAAAGSLQIHAVSMTPNRSATTLTVSKCTAHASYLCLLCNRSQSAWICTTGKVGWRCRSIDPLATMAVTDPTMLQVAKLALPCISHVFWGILPGIMHYCLKQTATCLCQTKSGSIISCALHAYSTARYGLQMLCRQGRLDYAVAG